MPRDADGAHFTETDGAAVAPWPAPDMNVISNDRRPAPALNLQLFGHRWARWITAAADAAASPVDYVALPLLAAGSALIGNARWAQATPGWAEPPHLWTCVVGDSGSSKSPGSDCIFRDALPEIERRMQGDFPERLREWKAEMETSKAATEEWEKNVREARKQKVPPPLPPAVQARREPQAPRLQQTDVTIERVASLLAGAAPKGLLICRDELAGWYLGMNSYNDAGRQFWIEAYGGRFYRVERQKHPEPIDVPRLVVAVTGGTQPEKLAALLRDPDDGLLARMLWAWPEPLPFRLGKAQPAIDTAIEALDRLRCLDMAPGANPDDKPTPIMVRLHSDMLPAIETFGQDMQARQAEAAGLMRSAYGKARGVALRLSLVLEMLRWCIDPVGHPEPRHIGEEAFLSACDLVEGYFLPMAERVYGDAAANPASRNVSTLARWILRTKPIEVHVRTLQRKVRLPGLRDANAIRQAADELVAADWLRPPVKGGYQERSRGAYSVNPALLEASP